MTEVNLDILSAGPLPPDATVDEIVKRYEEVLEAQLVSIAFGDEEDEEK